MIPIRDSIPSLRPPRVTLGLIVACGVVFIMQLAAGIDDRGFVERFGMIPARVSDPDAALTREVPVAWDAFGRVAGTREVPVEESPLPALLTLLSCIFLHGGFLHLIGNVWFLWIFGDNVEDRFGHGGFLAFYLGMGVLASLAHWISAPESTIPTIGASGAVAGVMGAYMVFYPRAIVLTVVPLFILFPIVALPAFLFLGIWFLIQVFNSAQLVGVSNVAWWAHIGGFVAGMLLALWVEHRDRGRPEYVRREGEDHVQFRRVRVRRPNEPF